MLYQRLCREYNVSPQNHSLNTAEKQAKQIVPNREFRGPIPSNYLFTGLGEDFDWYRKNQMKIGGNIGSKTFEIANLTNGDRNLLEIRDIISAEFGETDLEFVLHFAEDMKRMGLFSF